MEIVQDNLQFKRFLILRSVLRQSYFVKSFEEAKFVLKMREMIANYLDGREIWEISHLAKWEKRRCQESSEESEHKIFDTPSMPDQDLDQLLKKHLQTSLRTFNQSIKGNSKNRIDPTSLRAQVDYL